MSGVEIVDPHTIVFTTDEPVPLLATNFASVGIVSAEAYGGEDVVFAKGGCENLGTPPQAADFDDPAKAIGTGPYKVSSFRRGDVIELSRNESYWDGTPTWRRSICGRSPTRARASRRCSRATST